MRSYSNLYQNRRSAHFWQYVLILSLFCAATLSVPCFGDEYGKVTSEKIAEGVYLFTISSYGDVGMCGNSVAILTEECVLMFDSTSTPATASTVLGEVKKLTNKPVRYLVNSHWHWDHWGGNQVFAAAFPDLQIITHEKNLQQMKEVEPSWNDDGLKVQLPGYVKSLEQKLDEDRSKHAPESEIKDLEQLISADRDFLTQKTSLTKTFPNVTFSDSMTVRPGGREINIMHARAITIGDTYVYLPVEKILITGDIMLSPFPFAIGGTYPADWLATLQQFAKLEPNIIIPGHGKAQTNKEFLQGYIALFQDASNQVKDDKTKGMTLDQTKEAVGKQASELSAKLGITDPNVVNAFKAYFLDVFVVRSYKELDQPLSDLPDGLAQ
jgi:cyclase